MQAAKPGDRVSRIRFGAGSKPVRRLTALPARGHFFRAANDNRPVRVVREQMDLLPPPADGPGIVS